MVWLDNCAKKSVFCCYKFITFYAALLKAIPPVATCYAIVWSVQLYVCHLSQLVPLDGMKCHLAGTLCGPK